jgi:hypothetical protein
MDKPQGISDDVFKVYGNPVDFEFTMADNELARLIAVFQFQGYDPVATYNELCRRATEKKISASDFKRDMFRLCVWFVLRGAKMPVDQTGAAKGENQGRSVEKTSDAAKAEIRRLKDLYGLVNTQPKNKTEINIARVIGCFPHVVASLMAQYPANSRKVIPAEKNADSYGCPVWLLFPQGISLIPLVGRDDWVQGFIEWSKDFDTIVNKGKQTAEPQLMTYIDATWKSKLMNDEARNKWIDKLTALANNQKRLIIPASQKTL